MDEIAEVIFSRGTIQSVINRLAYGHPMPPLHYIGVNLSMKLFGEYEGAIRATSALTGILSLVFIYFLGKEIFGKKEGILAAILLTFSTVHILYSQEARPYSFFMFFMLGSLLFLVRAIRNRKILDWIFFIVFTALSTQTHYYTSFFILGEFIFAFCMSVKVDREYTKLDLQILCVIAAILIVGILFYLTPTYSLVSKRPKGWEAGNLPGLLSLNFLRTVLKRAKQVLIEYHYNKILYAGLFSFSLIYGVIKDKRWLILVFGFLVVPSVAGMVFSDVFGIFNSRYLLPVFPVLVLGVSKGIAISSRLTDRLLRKLLFANSKQIYAAGIFTLVAVGMDIKPLVDYYRGEKQNYRGGLEYIKKNMGADDIIIIGAVDGGIYDYYIDKLGLSKHLKKIGSLPDLAKRYLQNGKQTVWYTYSFGGAAKMTPYLFQWMEKHFEFVENLPSIYGGGMSVKVYKCAGDYPEKNKRILEDENKKLEEDLIRSPQDLALLHMLAYNWLLIKKYAKAQFYFGRILESQPDNESIKNLFNGCAVLKEGFENTRNLLVHWINNKVPPDSRIVIAEELNLPQILIKTQEKNLEVIKLPQSKIFPLACLNYDYVILAAIEYKEEIKKTFYDSLFSDWNQLKRINGDKIIENESKDIVNPGFIIYSGAKSKDDILLKGGWIRYSNQPEAKDVYYYALGFLKDLSIPGGYGIEIIESNNKLKRVEYIWDKTQHGVFTTRGAPGYLYISPVDGSNPNNNGKTYKLSLIKNQQ